MSAPPTGVARLDLGGQAGLQRPEREVDQVGAHVAQRPVPKGKPAPPVEVGVVGVVAPVDIGRADPGVPVEAGGRRRGGGAGHALRPDRPVGPHMHLAHRADHPAPDQFDHAAPVVSGMALVAHLGDELRIGLRQPQQQATLRLRIGQGLLHIDVDAALHRPTGGDGVVMVGRGDDDGVDVLPRIQHPPVVGEALGFVVGLLQRHAGGEEVPLLVGERLQHMVVVHIGGGDDVLAGQLEHVGRTLPARPDRRDVHPIARRQTPRRAKRRSRDGPDRGNRHSAEKGATGEAHSPVSASVRLI